MGKEIERKYLVNREKWNAIDKGERKAYQQGYILTDAEKTIRVRLSENDAFITIKGLLSGASRDEYEYKIPKKDAQELLDKFCQDIVSKVRHRVLYEGKLWEIDEFSGDNEGLILAEIELSDEEEKFDLPEWIDKEVTDDKRYYNSNLSQNPYKNWKDNI
jgi:CYTH domain-containing protein